MISNIRPERHQIMQPVIEYAESMGYPSDDERDSFFALVDAVDLRLVYLESKATMRESTLRKQETMTSEVSLLQCPFCRGTHNGYSSRPVLEELSDDDGGGWRVTCYGCGVGQWRTSPTSRQAVDRWNTRALHKATSGKSSRTT